MTAKQGVLIRALELRDARYELVRKWRARLEEDDQLAASLALCSCGLRMDDHSLCDDEAPGLHVAQQALDVLAVSVKGVTETMELFKLLDHARGMLGPYAHPEFPEVYAVCVVDAIKREILERVNGRVEVS